MTDKAPIATADSESHLKIIVSAYAVFPSPTAEGIVNGCLLDILRQQAMIGLVTSHHGYTTLDEDGTVGHVETYMGKPDDQQPSSIDLMARWLSLPKWHPFGATSRLLDRIRVNWLQLPPLSMTAWSQGAAMQILEWLEGDYRDAVVWSRGTPPESLEAAILAYRQRPFPLIVNYNDPMPRSLLWGERLGQISPALDELQHRQNEFLARHAQAWTFPSRGLADLMIESAGFDSTRCFVIPHAVPSPSVSRVSRSLPIEPGLVYSGTFYGAAFSESIKSGMAAYAQAEARLRFMFILNRPTQETLDWIRQNIPGARIYTDRHPQEVADWTALSSGLLVIGDAHHGPLLLTKVGAAVRSGKPVLAFAPEGTTTYDVVAKTGGMAVETASAQDVEAALVRFEQRVLSVPEQRPTSTQTWPAFDRFSEQRIVEDSLSVLRYAKERFDWQQHTTGTKPAPPEIEPWP